MKWLNRVKFVSHTTELDTNFSNHTNAITDVNVTIVCIFNIAFIIQNTVYNYMSIYHMSIYHMHLKVVKILNRIMREYRSMYHPFDNMKTYGARINNKILKSIY